MTPHGLPSMGLINGIPMLWDRLSDRIEKLRVLLLNVVTSHAVSSVTSFLQVNIEERAESFAVHVYIHATMKDKLAPHETESPIPFINPMDGPIFSCCVGLSPPFKQTRSGL